MFYSISQSKKENFSNFYQLGKYVISTDAGWSQQGNYVYKGYADKFDLAGNLSADHTNTGNYTIFEYCPDTQELSIRTDKYRSYPIFVYPEQITNLIPGGRTVWADSILTVQSDFSVNEQKFDVIGKIDTTPLTFDQALEKVDHILANKTQEFLSHNQTPIRAFASGGVDSTLVLAYLSKHTDNFELVKCNHLDHDKFWLLNSGTLTNNFWAYKQIHHWISPTVLTSGAPGDEFMLRSPTTSNWLIQNNGMNMLDLLEDRYSNSLHCDHFKKYKQLFQAEFVPVDHKQLIYQICNNVVNDWQHWHIGNTLTWTPLRDLEITKIMLRVPVDQMLGQILNSNFSRSLILRTAPNLNQIISDRKNSGNYMKNLVDLYEHGIK